jgi:hypothetical protein
MEYGIDDRWRRAAEAALTPPPPGAICTREPAGDGTSDKRWKPAEDRPGRSGDHGGRRPGGPALFPGFDAGAQFISELGGPKAAPNPLIFNIGMVLAGLAGIAAGAGFAHALEHAGGRRRVSAFAGLWVAMTGLGALFAGLFHWPDPMHRACGVGLAIQFAPLFTAWALWGKPSTAGWPASRWAGSSSCCWSWPC